MVRCPRRVIVGVCITAAFAVAAAATGTGGVIQALKCKAALHSCSPSAAAEVPPDCRSQYASCAGRSVISVIVCIFLFMAAVASAMCTLSAWTHAHAQQPQQQDQDQEMPAKGAAAAQQDGDDTSNSNQRDQGAGVTAVLGVRPQQQQQAQQQPVYSKAWDWPALVLFLWFVVASIAYFAVRATKSLDTSRHRWYPVTLLVVELFGYTAMLPYAWMLVRRSRVKPLTTAQLRAMQGHTDGGLLPFDPPPTTFHVMVPCYLEESENFEEDGSQDIPMIRGTLEAILSCYIPPGCRLTVTLCDDGQRKVDGLVGPARTDEGKAKQLQKFGALAKARAELAAQLEEMFTGDAGRLFRRSCRPLKYKDSDKQTNGKSANVNWALRQGVYGNGRRPQANEVIVIFDCDHRPEPHFFTRVLQVMSETRADLVLTPQFFSNTEAGADIFNNDNIQFWKYLLPGYDASDYVACTGTNFAIKATALQEAGWFPDNTVTEDYALSLKLKAKGFKGRYLYEHLATGLAPVEPRPWFQQRSRWTKGHFEVLFNSAACPLAFWRYSGHLGQRLYAAILYMIGTWSYITNFVSTPVFFLVPFFYLVLGLAPIAFTWQLGLAASVYLLLSQLMMGYVSDIKDAKSIWLAGISNTVLSFTYFKAFLNTALTAAGLKPKGGFKPTMGAAAAIAQALDPLVLLTYLVTNLFSVGIAIYMIISQLAPVKGYQMLLEQAAAGTINLNLFMPLFWACHNCVAPLVYFAYVASFNRNTPEQPPGRAYQRFVNAIWIADTTCLAGALGCLWWSIILPSQGAQRSLFEMMSGYAAAVQAKAVVGA